MDANANDGSDVSTVGSVKDTPKQQHASFSPAIQTTVIKKPPESKGRRKKSSSSKANKRDNTSHSFQTDAVEVQHMEKGLLKLMDDFNSGRLRAFGRGCSMEQMERLRDQQESLAKLHFELGGADNDDMDRLMDRLEELSISIGQLDPSEGVEKEKPKS